MFGRVLRSYQSTPAGVFFSVYTYPTEVFGKVRYGLNALPNTPAWFGTSLIPVYTRHFGVKFGTRTKNSLGTGIPY